MGEAHGTITRREVLKRGAIVGGGVLWVTPVVQTLTMGRAYAAAASGDSCNMTLEVVGCRKNTKPGWEDRAIFTFRLCVPYGCTCNPLPDDYVYNIVTQISAGTVWFFPTTWVKVDSNCSEFEMNFGVDDGDTEIYVICGTFDSSQGTQIIDRKAESEHVVVSAQRVADCLAETGG